MQAWAMLTKKILFTCLSAMLLPFWSHSASACSICTVEGDCVAVTTSGNCSCSIRHTDRGVQLCKPVGVCDPQDVTSCDSGSPQPMGKAVRVDAFGLRQLESNDRLVGAAIWGATEQTFAQDGTSTGTFLAVGIHEGTLKASDEEVGYRFRVVVSEGEAGGMKLRGKLMSETGGVIEFRADLAAGGRSGRLLVERDSRGPAAPRELTWDAAAQGSGRQPSP